MKALYIAANQIIREFRDVRTIALMVLLPIVLISILGTALDKDFRLENIESTSVCYLNEDNGEIAKHFTSFLYRDDIKRYMDIVEIKDLTQGIELINENKAEAIIYVKKGFTHDVIEGRKGTIEIYGSEYSGFELSTIKNIVDSFVSAGNTSVALYSMDRKIDLNDWRSKSIIDMPIVASGGLPKAIDYYAVTMAVMIIMYGVLTGNYAIWGDIISNTYMRIRSAPITGTDYILGKIMGCTAALFLQGMIVVCFSKFVYKANWGKDIITIMGIILLLSILATTLGIAACSVTKDGGKASGLINIVVVVFTLLGGGYVKLDNMGELMAYLSYLSPNYLGTKVIFNSIYGGSYDITVKCIIALMAITGVTFMGAVAAWRRSFN